MKHIIKSADKRVETFLKRQVVDDNSRFFGGIKGDILDVKPTVYAMTTAVAAYLNEESRFYLDEALYASLDMALSFVGRNQREDGSFDFPSCNFISAPDTAFCFKRLLAAYHLLINKADEGAMLAKKYLVILKNALNAIKNGGFHTPNHRWAITAALMQGVNLYDGESDQWELIKRAEQYLAEGIDGNEDGEYAERSTGNYNAVVNHALISLYEVTGDKDYLKYVEKNLHMMLTYIDPDDTIFTQNSTRQDKGKPIYADKYFYQYLYMASMLKNKEFDAAAHKLIKDNMERGDLAPDCLHIMMLHDAIRKHRFEGYGFLDEYKVHYKASGVYRAKKGTLSYSVLNQKEEFLFIKVNSLQISVRILASYCDIRNFVPQSMNIDDEGVRLTSKAVGWYYLPFDEKQDSSDWWQMDHSKRKLLNSSNLNTEVLIIEKPDGIALKLKTDGIDSLPLRVELCVPDGCVLENDQFYLSTKKGDSMVLKNGYVMLSDNLSTIKLGPGHGSHVFKGHYSEDGRIGKGYTIYLNEYTPCDMSITFSQLHTP